jgi:hypothetical protein
VVGIKLQRLDHHTELLPDGCAHVEHALASVLDAEVDAPGCGAVQHGDERRLLEAHLGGEKVAGRGEEAWPGE